MKEIYPQIEVKITYDDYDVTLTDIKHDDNSVTLTREEAMWVFNNLKKIL